MSTEDIAANWNKAVTSTGLPELRDGHGRLLEPDHGDLRNRGRRSERLKEQRLGNRCYGSLLRQQSSVKK